MMGSLERRLGIGPFAGLAALLGILPVAPSRAELPTPPDRLLGALADLPIGDRLAVRGVPPSTSQGAGAIEFLPAGWSLDIEDGPFLEGTVTESKSGGRVRVLGISPTALDALRAWLLARLQQAAGEGSAPTSLDISSFALKGSVDPRYRRVKVTCSIRLEATIPGGASPVRGSYRLSGKGPFTGARPRLYVADYGGGTISVVDAGTLAPVATVAVGGFPAGVAVLPTLRRVCVADADSGVLTLIDAVGLGVLARVRIGRPVAGLAVDDATGRAYLLDKTDPDPGTDLHVIDAASGEVLSSGTIGTKLQDIVVDGPGGRAYVTDFVDGLIVIDLSNGSVEATVPIADRAHGLALDAGAHRLYVTRVEGDSVVVVDTVSLEVVGSLPLPVPDVAQWVAIDPAADRTYVTGETTGSLYVLDTDTAALVATIPVGALPQHVLLDASTGRLFVTNLGADSLTVIATGTGTVEDTVPVGSLPVRTALN